MERVVQQNASLVERAARATEGMNAQAASLLGLASRFQLDEARAPAPAAERAPQPRASQPAAVAPIRYKPSARALPAAAAASPSAAGGWTEF
jgi:methyl-accepting chemotaxis protein